jgi:hypothetical protein
LPRQTKPPPPHLQPVPDAPPPPKKAWPLDISPEAKALVMHERELTVRAFRQLGAFVGYCEPRGRTPLEGGEKFVDSDPDLKAWIDDPDMQGLNSAITLHQGVIEARIFGPDDSLARCFFAACAKLGVQVRYAIARHSQATASSVLFKLRDDEAARFHEEYSSFRPKTFTIDDTRRGVILTAAPPAKKGSTAHKVTTLVSGSLLWHDNGADYDLLVWRDESGQKPSQGFPTGPQLIDFFSIVRAASYASILNLIPAKAWEEYGVRRSVSEWLARVVRDGETINGNVAFAKASRAIIADPGQAELLLTLICEAKDLAVHRDECRSMFQLARKRIKQDSNPINVAGWSIIRERFGEQTEKALRSLLVVGADSTLLEQFAERYLYCHGEFIDRQAFAEGRDEYVFSKDELALQHAPDQILTHKKPLKAFPVFIESKTRQEVTGIDCYPDSEPGAILRVTRQGAIIPNDDYAPELSRLIFNRWGGLHITPARTIDGALRTECEERLAFMLTQVTNDHPERADWIKAHLGWTLKHPGQKQQVALVCTGDQGTGKTFLCKDFARAIFDKYASVASVRAMEEPFYIPAYVDKLWVNHDEVVSKSETIEIIKELIRSTRVSGQYKGQNVREHTTFARLAFTSNETNPGLSRGGPDRGLFQVTSITAAHKGMLPGEFEDWTNKNLKPFYAEYDAFLKRDDVRQAYVKLLIDCAPAKISDVEDLTHSAMRDSDVAAEQLTPAQLIAREIIEEGTIWGGWDIAMPFRLGHLQNRVRKAQKDMGLSGFMPVDAVLNLFLEAGILKRPESGYPFLFAYKVGELVRLFGDYLGVPLHFRWPLEPNDYMPNDYRGYEELTPWKGRGK